MVSLLAGSPALSEARGKPEYDTDMAELVAELLGEVVLDIVKVIDNLKSGDNTRQQAEHLLTALFPFTIRFLSDEYDEVCSTVIPAVLELLALMRKLRKLEGQLPRRYVDMLSPLLDAIVTKTRYDDASEWGEEGEETDEAEFQDLRKRLRVLPAVFCNDRRVLVPLGGWNPGRLNLHANGD